MFILSAILVLCSGLIWGSYAVISSRINQKAEKLGINERANPLAVFISSNFYSVVVIGIVMIVFGQIPKIESLTMEAWFTVVYLALFCTIIPYILYISANRLIQATELNVILLVNIIISLMIAHIVLSEKLSLIGILGSALIISSIYLVCVKSN